MVEEVFGNESNSQIYLNDHLTPYFSNIYLIARRAKREGKLSSASSYGGKIRARKNFNDAPTLITNERQLNALVNMESELSNSNGSIQLIDDNINTSQSSIKTTNNNKPYTKINNRNNSENRQKSNTKRVTRDKPSKRKLANVDEPHPAKKHK